MAESFPVHVDPKGPPPKAPRVGPPPPLEDPAVIEARVAEAKARLAAEEEAQHKAKKQADEAERRRKATEQVENAQRMMRVATPDEPVVLRRVELRNSLDPRSLPLGFASPTQLVDLANGQWRPFTLLFDGTLVHVIHEARPDCSFWVPVTNVAALYPKTDA